MSSHGRLPVGIDLSQLLAEHPGRYSTRSGDRLDPRHDETLSEIGRGGIGRVVVVCDEHLGRDIALKELLPDQLIEVSDAEKGSLSHNSYVIARFLREARITAQLEHPNIIPVYEVGRKPDGNLYYTMKLVRGRTLHTVLGECKTASERVARTLSHFVGVCHAVAYAHSRGVIHRDIKPSNIMVGEFGETILLDWGVAKVKGEKELRGFEIARKTGFVRDRDVGKTTDGATIGTPAYMSPEAAAGRLEMVDEQSDIWSLGAVLYHILTGQAPSKRGDPFSVLDDDGQHENPEKHFSRQFAEDLVLPVRKLCAQAPPELEAIAEKAMRWNKAWRYRSASELAEEVQAFQTGGLVGAYGYSSWDMVRRFASRHKAGLAGGLFIILALIVSLITVTIAYESESTAGRLSQFHIAEALNEKAGDLAAHKRMLAARIYAAASLRFNPANENSPFFNLGFEKEYPHSRLVRAEAASAIYLAEFRKIRRVERIIHTNESNARGMFSPDGRSIACGTFGGRVAVWDVESGRLVWERRAHEGAVWRSVYSPDGKLLATAGHDGQVLIWDAQSGRRIRDLTDLPCRVWGLLFLKDSRTVVAADDQGVIHAWDVTSGKQRFQVQEHSGSVHDLDLSPDGSHLVSVGRDRAVRLWDTENGLLLATWRDHRDALWSVAFSPDGMQIATGCEDGSVRIWDAQVGRSRMLLKAHRDGVYSVRFSPDGKLLVSSSIDSTCRMWEVASGQSCCASQAHQASVWGVDFSPDGKHLASFSRDKTIRLWEVNSDKSLATLRGHTDHVWRIVFSPKGDWLASAGLDKTVRIWDWPSGKERAVLSGHSHAIHALAVSPDGALLASGGFDDRIIVWEAATGRELARLSGHTGEVYDLAFSRSSKRLYSVSMDKTYRIWSVSQPMRQIASMERPHPIRSLHLSPDGTVAALADMGGAIDLIDPDSGKSLMTLGRHGNWATAVSFSHDGQTLASCGKDGEVYLWDPKTGKRIYELRDHEQFVNHVRFSWDDHLLATGGDDRKVILWSVSSGQPLLVLDTRDYASGFDFSPDGRILAVGDANDVTLYPLDFSVLKSDASKVLRQAEADAGLKLAGFRLEQSEPGNSTQSP